MPTGLTLQATSQTTIEVSWNASPGATGYKLSDNLTLVTLDPASTTYSWTVTPGSYKCFHVAAVSNAGSSAWTAWVCTTSPGTSGAPSVPTSVAAAGISASQIRISWTSTAADASGYRVRRWNGTTWAILADNLAASAGTYTDAGLTAGTSYQYMVCAYNSAGETCANSVAGTTK